MKKNETPGKITAVDLLDAVPVRNESVRRERKSEDETVLYVPVVKRWYMGPPLSWLMPFSREKGIALDRLGAEVWEACDGKRTTEAMIEEFAGRHHVTFHEARLSVLTFLRELTRRGLVVMVSARHEGAKS